MSSNNTGPGPLRLTTLPPASRLLKFPCDILTDILFLLLVEDLLSLEQVSSRLGGRQIRLTLRPQVT